jgi:hypothetical protein
LQLARRRGGQRGKYLEEVLYLSGCLLIVAATALLSWIAALYVVGVMLILAGVLVGLLQAHVKFGRPTVQVESRDSILENNDDE